MRNPEDLPRVGRPRRSRNGRIGIGAVVALLLLAGSLFRGTAVFYTDFLWFRSVSYTDVWANILSTKLLLGAVSVLFFFAVLWINLWVVDRFAPRTAPGGLRLNDQDELARSYQHFVRPRAGKVRTLAALGLALFGGSSFYVHWNEWLLFRNGGSFGLDDAQFSKDIGFFVFKLPFLTALVQWLFYAVVFALIVSLVAHYLQGAIRPQASSGRISSAVKVHMSVLLGILALIRAAHYFLERYRLSYSERGVVTGANYTDVNFLLPALGLLTLISLLAAVLFFVGARSKSWSWPVITVALWAVVSLLVGALIPAGVQQFSVLPAEPKKEGPYIQRNIDATRKALGLEAVQVSDFAYTDDLKAEALLANAQTIRNVRLWDPTYLTPSYKRLQESRSYFQFNDIDVDRYPIGDQTTQMMLSVRELNPQGLPQDRRSWVNQHLAYTHGYGLVASPANAVSSNGAPEFTVKDLPPTGSPQITVPQVYFGERTNEYSIVKTRQGEVDFTAADGRDQLSSYEGRGGVVLDSFIDKVAFAARVGNINPLISGLVTEESRAMYLTNIRERVQKVAPFLQFDNDPYPILLDGRILWMQDAYTTTSFYPYGQTADTNLVARNGMGGALSDVSFNYVRNSVKIVTDAYDGAMTLYITDSKDPIIRAWEKAYPKLFRDGAEMPAGLREHTRYPEDLFRVQSTMFGSYHLTNAQDFYSKSDRWNIAQKPGFGTPATTVPPATLPGAAVRQAPLGEQRIEPYYLLMRLPGEPNESYLMFQPFVPFSQDDSRKELSAFMVAKSDPDQYGKLQAFVMPRGQQVDGPAIVEGRIQQEPSISQYITLLDREGSRVDLGNMLIIPVDNSLLYVRPLYVEAQQTRVPEFKKAIVVQGNRIAMEDTLQKALAKIFGSAPATLERNAGSGTANPFLPPATGGTVTPPAATPGVTTIPPAGQPPANVQALLDQANAAFAAAEQSLRDGNLAAYQANVQRGADLVRQARALTP